MRLALQRPLARPSSLDFLANLVNWPALKDALQSNKRPYTCPRLVRCRRYATAATVTHDIQASLSENVTSRSADARLHEPATAENYQAHALGNSLVSADESGWHLSSTIFKREWNATTWDEHLRTSEQLEFESDMDRASYGNRRLIDRPIFSHNIRLWAYLMNFRKRRYGNDGVVMFWKAIRARELELPTEGSLAEHFWVSFLDLGFKNQNILSDICHYADELYKNSGKRWPKLYVYVLQHMLVEGKRDQVIHWHDRLIERHSPGPEAFRRFLRNVIHMRGDQEALKEIYIRHKHRKTYNRIVSVLLGREDFQAALDWHDFLMRHGDFPSSQKIVEPLIRYLEIYDPPKAVSITKSLVAAGVSFASTILAELEKSRKISREMMNLIHGEAFHIEPKKYNDRLGARWFATKWISLDIAINAVHALGVEAIGPLSLQAIALREADPAGVVRRLDQLQELGISIGNSVFSKAVESFARKQEAEYLQGLLASDQHPDSLEDWKLQESLLAAYAQAGDWVQYRRTFAIRLVGSPSPRIDKYNVLLRKHVTTGDRSAIIHTLEEMRMGGIAVSQMTIRYILRKILQPRLKGRSICPSYRNLNDLHTAISILTNIMKFNGFVSMNSWREIISRLGMLGQLDELDRLCLWLAAWYKPGGNLRSQSVGLSSPPLPVLGLHVVPAQVPTSHPLHPLRILFPDSLQRALVEWGFIHALLRRPSQSEALGGSVAINSNAEEDAHHYTRGIKLLRQLRREGVFIRDAQIRHALLNRFAILYGPGESRSVRNRLAKRQNVLGLEDMVGQVDKAWGGKVFLDMEDLKWKIESGYWKSGYKRMTRPEKLSSNAPKRLGDSGSNLDLPPFSY